MHFMRKIRRTQLKKALAGLCAMTVIGINPVWAANLPVSGSVVRGGATITPSGTQMLISNVQNKSVINWQSFSIGAGNEVHFSFLSPQGYVLNRVTGSEASLLAGKLAVDNPSSQTVILMNPNGITMSNGFRLDVPQFVGTTLNIGEDAFDKVNINNLDTLNTLLFGENPYPSAGVIQTGTLDPSSSVRGLALVGNKVTVNGTLEGANLTAVGLMAAERASLTTNFDANTAKYTLAAPDGNAAGKFLKTVAGNDVVINGNIMTKGQVGSVMALGNTVTVGSGVTVNAPSAALLVAVDEVGFTTVDGKPAMQIAADPSNTVTVGQGALIKGNKLRYTNTNIYEGNTVGILAGKIQIDGAITGNGDVTTTSNPLLATDTDTFKRSNVALVAGRQWYFSGDRVSADTLVYNKNGGNVANNLYTFGMNAGIGNAINIGTTGILKANALVGLGYRITNNGLIAVKDFKASVPYTYWYNGHMVTQYWTEYESAATVLLAIRSIGANISNIDTNNKSIDYTAWLKAEQGNGIDNAGTIKLIGSNAAIASLEQTGNDIVTNNIRVPSNKSAVDTYKILFNNPGASTSAFDGHSVNKQESTTSNELTTSGNSANSSSAVITMKYVPVSTGTGTTGTGTGTTSTGTGTTSTGTGTTSTGSSTTTILNDNTKTTAEKQTAIASAAADTTKEILTDTNLSHAQKQDAIDADTTAKTKEMLANATLTADQKQDFIAARAASAIAAQTTTILNDTTFTTPEQKREAINKVVTTATKAQTTAIFADTTLTADQKQVAVNKVIGKQTESIFAITDITTNTISSAVQGLTNGLLSSVSSSDSKIASIKAVTSAILASNAISVDQQKAVVKDFVQNSLLKPSGSSNSGTGIKAVVQIIQNEFKNSPDFLPVAHSFDNAVEDAKKKSNQKQSTVNSPAGQGSASAGSSANF